MLQFMLSLNMVLFLIISEYFDDINIFPKVSFGRKYITDKNILVVLYEKTTEATLTKIFIKQREIFKPITCI